MIQPNYRPKLGGVYGVSETYVVKRRVGPGGFW